ncbi:MAG: Na/Pi cotransporter family protein [Tissierellia bacterium]|nr:Na/Pi cotransporter family protein [Tissierellia bacterium]
MEIVLPILGGLGIFIYGMNLMGSGLQKAAGSRLKKMIAVLTKNRFLGVVVGALVTAIIQSSSATTVMVIGFVNAGLMNLYQAVGIIMGANIGTTITSQLIAFNLTAYAPLAVVIGVFMSTSTKDKKRKDMAEILIGLGLLFIGMDMMKNGLEPLSKTGIFENIMVKLTNPWLAMLTGVIFTTAVQSSSAAIGILQALASKNLITMNIAFPVLFGENIGTTTTGLLSSVGASNNAKRAAFIHLMFNTIGTLLFMFVLRHPIEALVAQMTPGNMQRQIANSHSLFNIINTVIQFPFAGFLVRASEKLIKGDEKEKIKASLYLDKRMLSTPSIAAAQVRKEILHMAEKARENLFLARGIVLEKQFDNLEKLEENEDILNQLNYEITEYVVDLNKQNISEAEVKSNNLYIYALNDIERIGDHIINIGELSVYSEEHNINFSDQAKSELEKMFDLVELNLNDAVSAFESFDIEGAKKVRKTEQEIDDLEREYRDYHVDRLQRGICDSGAGIMFLDTISNLERISDHCYNISGYVLENS